MKRIEAPLSQAELAMKRNREDRRERYTLESTDTQKLKPQDNKRRKDKKRRKKLSAARLERNQGERSSKK